MYKIKKFFLPLRIIYKKSMKKIVILALLLGFAGVGAMAQDNEKVSKVEHLTYDAFLKKVWDFEKNPNEFVFKGKTPAIVDFYADWCGPCRKVAPIMEKLALDYDGQLAVYKVNTDQEKQLAAVFQVRSIPMVLFIPMEGKPMMQVGAMPEEGYKQVIDEQLLKKAE